MVVQTPWDSDEHKHVCLKRMRAHMRKLGVTAYSVIMEAWGHTISEKAFDDEGLLPAHLRPSLQPERQELVIACAASADHNLARYWRTIRKATTERIIRLEPVEDFSKNEDQYGALFFDMLNPCWWE